VAELFEVAELAGVTDVADVQRYCDEQARHILAHCDVRGLKIACAESLTAGLLADSFVRIPGASSVFLGSAVTYDIHAKAMVLGVDAELLRTHGAVDPEVARQMARGAAHLFYQEQYAHGVVGLSTTGVAGPGPDEGKPAGTVYIGFDVPCFSHSVIQERDFALRLALRGSRELVRHLTVACVLGKMREFTGSSQEKIPIMETRETHEG
jgi:nicotinamide-nucleotide amidase